MCLCTVDWSSWASFTDWHFTSPPRLSFQRLPSPSSFLLFVSALTSLFPSSNQGCSVPLAVFCSGTHFFNYFYSVDTTWRPPRHGFHFSTRKHFFEFLCGARREIVSQKPVAQHELWARIGSPRDISTAASAVEKMSSTIQRTEKTGHRAHQILVFLVCLLRSYSLSSI